MGIPLYGARKEQSSVSTYPRFSYLTLALLTTISPIPQTYYNTYTDTYFLYRYKFTPVCPHIHSHPPCVCVMLWRAYSKNETKAKKQQQPHAPRMLRICHSVVGHFVLVCFCKNLSQRIFQRYLKQFFCKEKLGNSLTQKQQYSCDFSFINFTQCHTEGGVV